MMNSRVPLIGKHLADPRDYKGMHKEFTLLGAGVLVPDKFVNNNRVITPVHVEVLKKVLNVYDEEKVVYLVEGFQYGFKLGHTGVRKGFESKNLISAIQNPSVLQKQIAKELESERLAGPFKEKPFKSFCCSPICLVPKNKKESFSSSTIFHTHLARQ